MAFLRLEDSGHACHQLSLSLVPQGLLFAQVLSGPCPLTSRPLALLARERPWRLCPPTNS